MAKTYRVGLNLGTLCNLQCKYCYEHGMEPTEVSEKYLLRYASYLQYLVSTFPEGTTLAIGIFGGEPLLHLDKLEKFIRQTSSFIKKYIITINGTLVDDCKEGLLRLKQYNDSGEARIDIHVSYDFTLQDSMRCAGTYESVRDAIRWLYAQGLCTRVTPVFTFETMPHFKEVFLDYVELQKELPKLRMVFNIDKYAYEVPLGFNESAVREQLAFVRDYIETHPELQEVVKYNRACCTRRWEPADNKAFFRNLVGAMVEDGTMYPAWSMPYYHEKGRELLRFGHITDDFADIVAAKDALIAKLPKMSVPDACAACALNCHLTPFQNITESLDQWNQQPAVKGTCYLTRLINEYIPLD